MSGLESNSQFMVSWWNGGGGLLKRIKINPELKDFLELKPNIFVYGESELSSSSGLFLKSINLYFTDRI